MKKKQNILARLARFIDKPEQHTPQNEESIVSLPIPSVVSEEFDYIGSQDAMVLLGVSAPTLRRYAALGFYKKYRFGEKRTYYRRAELIAFLRREERQEGKGGEQ